MKARALLLALSLATPAVAASFDDRGLLHFDEQASASESFEAGEGAIVCSDGCNYEIVEAGRELAVHGKKWVSFIGTFQADLALPQQDASYRFSVWVRHGRVNAFVAFEHSTERAAERAYLFPSGQVTSDGWVELVTNSVSVAGSELERAYLEVEGNNVDLDAVEAVPDGSYQPGSACLGAFDPVCGPEALCISERCRDGSRYVPPLPDEAHRQQVIDYLRSRITWLFGGRYTRLYNMPKALAVIDQMRSATTAWQFWSRFAHGVRLLSDWHTSFRAPIGGRSPRNLGLCFIEGRADLTQGVWPSAPDRADLLVSHVADDNPLGLRPGDRLVAVDGKHPVDWARSLVSVSFDWFVADDPTVDAEFAEAMRGLITKYARSFSVIRCDAASGSCADRIETIRVPDIPDWEGRSPRCDNRPSYHLENPPDGIESTHDVPFWPWRDRVVDSASGENIYGMTFDNLYGTEQGLTPALREANDFFRNNARGVILDHRAGNGGTIDAPQALTQLVRSPLALSVGPGFMTVAGDDGPASVEEGVAFFEQFSRIDSQLYRVGSETPDLDLPVALLLHRDGSASDWLPHGMKGAPKVKIFGPHPTAGAFSSFYQYGYWSGISFQLASGDTVTFEGSPLIGHGIAPDVVVEHTQSALMQGRDLPYEAALEWVRGNLK